MHYPTDSKTGKRYNFPKGYKESKVKTIEETEVEKLKSEKERLKINEETYVNQVKVETEIKEPVKEKPKEKIKLKPKKK